MKDILEPKELVALLTRAQDLLNEIGHRQDSRDKSGIVPMCAVVLCMYDDRRQVKRLARKASRRKTGMFMSGDEGNLPYFDMKVRDSLKRATGKGSIPNSPDSLKDLVKRLNRA